MPSRLSWHDDYDHELVRIRLAATARGQCAGWDWVRFADDEHGDDLWARLATEIGLSPAFGAPGKVVYCYGEPACAARLVEDISSWTEGKGRCPVGPDVMLLLISPPGAVLAKAISAAAKSESEWTKGLAKAHPVSRLTKNDAPRWVVQRGATLGIMVMDDAARLMVEMSGTDPNVLTMEIRRLKHLSSDGRIMLWVVEQHCHAKTEMVAFALEDAILAGNHEKAFALGLASGDDAFRMMASLAHSMRKYMIVESCGGDVGSISDLIKGMKVLKDKRMEPMFANIGPLRTAASKLAGSGKSAGWPFRAVMSLAEAQISIRKDKDAAGRLMADMAVDMADQ
jgi:hypothetical protein